MVIGWWLGQVSWVFCLFVYFSSVTLGVCHSRVMLLGPGDPGRQPVPRHLPLSLQPDPKNSAWWCRQQTQLVWPYLGRMLLFKGSQLSLVGVPRWTLQKPGPSLVTVLRSHRLGQLLVGAGAHGLGSRVAQPGAWKAVGVSLAPGEFGPMLETLRSSLAGPIFQRIEFPLFVLCSMNASAEETTGISFEKEFGPWRPPPHLPMGGPELVTTSSKSLRPQECAGSPGDRRRFGWIMGGQ